MSDFHFAGGLLHSLHHWPRGLEETLLEHGPHGQAPGVDLMERRNGTSWQLGALHSEQVPLGRASGAGKKAVGLPALAPTDLSSAG